MPPALASETPPGAAVHETACIVVGGGPAGMVLAYLLARAGVGVTVLEAQGDFARDFRGDTLHPSILEALDAVGLTERLLRRPHARVYEGAVTDVEAGERVVVADLRRLRSPFPFIALMPQEDFLAFLAEEAARFPAFRLVMGANVTALIEEDGVVRGVRYGGHEVRAPLTVATDGRASRVRKLAGLTLDEQAPPMDVLWFRLPRRDADPEADAVAGYVGHDGLLVLIERDDHWQAGFVVPKGGYRALRAEGIAAFRAAVARRAPWLGGRLEAVGDWADVALLTVQAGLAPRWHRPGLLLLGDAAHPMSPVAGVGINYAVMDAVAAANRLVGPLLRGAVAEADLAGVQRRRQGPVRRAQAVQRAAQEVLVRRALAGRGLPPLARWLPRVPLLRRLPAWFVGHGFGRVRPDARVFARS